MPDPAVARLLMVAISCLAGYTTTVDFNRVFAAIIWKVYFFSHKFTGKAVATFAFYVHCIEHELTARFTTERFNH